MTASTEPVSIRLIGGRRMQCKDIPDATFADAVRRSTPAGLISRMAWDVHNELEAALGPVPVNLFFAKARRLVDRGLIGGCPCGCRGDFHLPHECVYPEMCCRPGEDTPANPYPLG